MLSTSLFSDSLQQGQKQLPPSQTPPPAPQSSLAQPAVPAVDEEYEEDDTDEVDEDIIIQDEENTNDDEGVHN